jgi:hypothetical protein
MKTFEEFEYNFADAGRMDFILEFLEQIIDEPDYNTEEPDTDDLLDPYDGYDDETYIQQLENGEFMYYEGWSKLCWKGLYRQPKYKGMSKKEALDQFLSVRFPIIARETNTVILDSGYDWYESWRDDVDDGYIMWVKLKRKE